MSPDRFSPALLLTLLGLSLTACSPVRRAAPDLPTAAAHPECAVPESEGVSVLGAVERPGRYPTSVAPTLLHALQDAGGLTPLAWKSGVVVRRCHRAARVDVEAIARGDAEDLSLQPGDVILVPVREL